MDRALRILIKANLVRLPRPARDDERVVGRDVLATLASNLVAFGYGLSRDGFDELRRASDGAARAWWEEVEPVLMDLTGADRKMDEHVVYKNFPHEVLAMSDADYWLRQILMYWGLPNEWFTEAELPRKPIDERIDAKILHPAKAGALEEIFRSLLDQPARWTPAQEADALFLVDHLRVRCDLSTVSFKENMVRIAVHCIEKGLGAQVSTATDVLRVAVGMSKGDPSLREKTKLRNFRRKERRYLLALLESASSIEADFARRPELMKRLVHQLHPGDYKDELPSVVAAADRLYKDTLPPTTSAIVEAKLRIKDNGLLEDLEARPGEMMRRIHHLLLVFGDDAATAFERVIPKLDLKQLVTMDRYFRKINERRFRTFPPKGNWAALQIVPADKKRRLQHRHLERLDKALTAAMRARLAKRVPSVKLSKETKLVKLPTNDSDLLPYGRGTVFKLPHHVRFLRTAVYWASGPTRANVWYDNGWNFFDERFVSKGACCWNAVRFEGALFSGDPTNSKDLDGRACQMIDLYLPELATAGVRYAVWNVLCYSHVAFDEAKEVFGALMWGADPEYGTLFEPARCQLSFPIKGPQFTKYIALLDVKERHVVYLDANLRATTSSAVVNGPRLEKVMPAFMEYLDSLPSVHDLFVHVPRSDDGIPILYDDHDGPVRAREAWIFRPTNEASRFEPFPLASLFAKG